MKGKPWYVQYTLRSKRYREKVGGSKEAAQIRLGEVMRKKETGQLLLKSDSLLTELLEHFKRSLESEPHADKTRLRMGNIFNNFEGYCTANGLERLNQFDYTVLEEYVNHRVTEAKIAPKTVNMEINVIKRIFAFAVKHRYLSVNPSEDLKQKKVQRKEPRYFSTGFLHDDIRYIVRYFVIFQKLH